MFLERVAQLKKGGQLPPAIAETLFQFYATYKQAIAQNRGDLQNIDRMLLNFVDLVLDQLKNPYPFEAYHERLTEPIDFYRMGIEFIAPIVKREDSKLLGLPHLDQIVRQLKAGENVVLLANHQTELDPQAISFLLEESYPQLAEEMIFVAGHRVVTDPLAVPFSKGRNLLCIYSKNYIDHPPEKKQEKIIHNQRTMKKMRELLSEGGCCIYVAPSGGRDRTDEKGEVVVAPFDPQSVEMFYFMAEHASRATHFYPMALYTYPLLPPPETVQMKLGEIREAKCTPIHLALGPQIDDAIHSPSWAQLDRQEQRKMRSLFIWEQVKSLYETIIPK